MTAPVELRCPQCGAPLAMEDVNVAADVILCRSCNCTGKFSDLVREKNDEEILETLPCRMKVMKTPRGLEVTYRKSKAIGFFFLFFALFWNGFLCVFLFSSSGKERAGSLIEQLFFIPFILVGIGVLVGAVYALFGRMTLTLNPGRGELFRGVGDMGRRQKFLLAKDARITIEDSSMRQNDRVLHKIVVEQPGGKPFQFGTGIAEDEALQYVAALLRQMRD